MSWLAELIDRLFSIIPQMVLIRAYECGIKFTRKGGVVKLEPGLHWYWPLVAEVVQYPVARTTANLPMQTLTTKDKVPCVVSAALVYEMRDPVKAYTENYDIDDTIIDIALAVVANAVRASESFDFDRLNKSLTVLVRKELKPFGIHLHRCSLTDAARCRVIRNVCDVSESES